MLPWKSSTPSSLRRRPPPFAARAKARALAAAIVDRITGGYTADAAADWQAIELNLRDAYHAIIPAQQASVEVT